MSYKIIYNIKYNISMPYQKFQVSRMLAWNFLCMWHLQIVALANFASAETRFGPTAAARSGKHQGGRRRQATAGNGRHPPV